MSIQKKMGKKKRSLIKWNIINSCLAGALVFLGGCADGNITLQGVVLAFLAGAAVAVSKFKDFWKTTKPQINTNLFNFLN